MESYVLLVEYELNQFRWEESQVSFYNRTHISGFSSHIEPFPVLVAYQGRNPQELSRRCASIPKVHPRLIWIYLFIIKSVWLIQLASINSCIVKVRILFDWIRLLFIGFVLFISSTIVCYRNDCTERHVWYLQIFYLFTVTICVFNNFINY